MLTYVEELKCVLAMLESWMNKNNKKVLVAKRIMKNVNETFTTSLSGYTNYKNDGFSVPYAKINLIKNSYKVRLCVRWDKPCMSKKERNKVYEEIKDELNVGFAKIRFNKFNGQIVIKGQLHVSVIA